MVIIRGLTKKVSIVEECIACKDIDNRHCKQDNQTNIRQIFNHMLCMSRISYFYTYSFTIQHSIATLAAGVGRAPLACCLEIFEA